MMACMRLRVYFSVGRLAAPFISTERETPARPLLCATSLARLPAGMQDNILLLVSTGSRGTVNVQIQVYFPELKINEIPLIIEIILKMTASLLFLLARIRVA